MGRRPKKGERKSGPHAEDDDDLPAHLQIINVGGRCEKKSAATETKAAESSGSTAKARRAERKSNSNEEEGEEGGGSLLLTSAGREMPRQKANHAPRPGQLGYEGVEDDGAAQSRYRGLSSGARASLRKKLEQNHLRRAYLRGELPEAPAGMMEAGPSAAATEAPAAPAAFVDAGVWVGELNARDVCDAARQRQCAVEGGGVVDNLIALAGPLCEGILGVYADAAEVCASVGGGRFGGWLAHGAALSHVAFGLEPRSAASHVSAARDDPILADLCELWRSPLCAALGPIGLDYAAVTAALDRKSVV